MGIRPRHWRPQRFDEINGKANELTVRRLQSLALKRAHFAALFLGPFGTAKTSLARLHPRSCCCRPPDPPTADPCQECEACLTVGPETNGDVHGYFHWEIDCTEEVGRKDVVEVIRRARQEDRAHLIFDELHRLGEHSAQESLLKFVEDFQRGVFIAVTITDPHEPQMRPVKVLPPLYDRLRKFYFQIPTESEMVSLLNRKSPDWGLRADEDTLHLLVRRIQRSFRGCLDLIDVAVVDNGGRLSRGLIDEFFGDVEEEDRLIAPYAEDTE